MRRKDKITQHQLKQFLSYSKTTGLFHWLNNNGHGIKSGQLAGSINCDGYVVINIFSDNYYAHRLAHLYVTGSFPEKDIDHDNRIKHDNRWKNIKNTVTRRKNNQNTGNFSHNKSGIKGVSFDKRNGKWRSSISIFKKVFNLGSYKDFDDAVCARLAAEQCLDWHGISPAQKYVRNNVQ